MIEARAREAIVRISGLLGARGWVANHDGNVSARVSPVRFMVTPTATHKMSVRTQDLAVTDAAGRQISGTRKPPGEFGLHLGIYRARTDVGAVVHAHPPFATALGVSGRELVVFLPEAVVSLGARVPLVPLTLPGAAAVTAMQPFVQSFDAVLVSGNGVWAWGDDPDQAYLRVELVEHLATIAARAVTWGGPGALPVDVVDAMLEVRKKIFSGR